MRPHGRFLLPRELMVAGSSQASSALPYRPELDGIRGLAVLLVFLQHAQLAGFVRAGWIGVTMFFTLSGFLITSLLLHELRERDRIDIARFYVRRALRLIPALILLLVFVAVVGVLARRDVTLQVAATLGYVSNWANVAGLDMWVLGHTWSLGIEEQFYVLWPLILLLVPSKRWILALCVLGVIASVVLRVVLFGPDAAAQNRWSHGLDTRADALLLGCLLSLTGWNVPRWAGWLGAGGLAFALVFFQSSWGLASAGLVLTGASTVLLIASRARLGWGPLVALGGISYGVYLWHFPIIELTRGLSDDMPGPMLVLLWAAATVGVAALSRRYIELPMLRLRDVPMRAWRWRRST